LDIPEVSLVAIMDADKEGFLRSERSLIQTIGRAARNAAGKAILYADTMTKSMQAAIKETERRREKQLQHNQQHGIVPKTIKKQVADIMEGAYGRQMQNKQKNKTSQIAEPLSDYSVLSPTDVLKQIKQLEEQMLTHAQNLEFEQAAQLRDQISALREQVF